MGYDDYEYDYEGPDIWFEECEALEGEFYNHYTYEQEDFGDGW